MNWKKLKWKNVERFGRKKGHASRVVGGAVKHYTLVMSKRDIIRALRDQATHATQRFT